MPIVVRQIAAKVVLYASLWAATAAVAWADAAPGIPDDAHASAYRLGLDWSDALNVSVTEGYGHQVSGNTALGIALRGGGDVAAGIVNLGFTLPGNRSVVMSAGRQRENLSLGGPVREWIGQDMLAVALEGETVDARAFLTDSAGGTSFVGTRSFGLSLGTLYDASEALTLSGSFGYQRLQWDDGVPQVERAIGGVGFTYAISERVSFRGHAHRGVSESRYGLEARWQLARGEVSASYTRIKATLGPHGDADRLHLVFSMPLGAGGDPPAAVTRVMRRPYHLPERVIVRPAGAFFGAIVGRRQ
jgi:hypothetical protein